MTATLQSKSVWSLRVDADGHPDPHGEFVARPPVPYHGGNTVRRKGIDDATAAAECRRNKAFLDRVVFTLSQRDRSRSLLEFAYFNGFRVKFDEDTTNDEKAVALVRIGRTNNVTRLILWPHVEASHGGPELLEGRTVNHEETHFRRNADGFMYNDSHTLASIKRMIKIQEIDAPIGGSFAVAEFLVDEPGAPPNAWKPRKVEAALLDYPETVRAAIVSGLPDLAAGRLDRYGAKVAASLVDADAAYYDVYMLRWLKDVGEGYRKNGETGNMAMFMQTDFTTEALVAKAIRLSGRPYLDPKLTHDPEFVKLADIPEVRKAYEALGQEVAEYNKLGFFPNIDIGFKGQEQVAIKTDTAPTDALKQLIPPAYVIASAQNAAMSLTS